MSKRKILKVDAPCAHILETAKKFPAFSSGWTLVEAYQHLLAAEPKLIPWIEQCDIPSAFTMCTKPSSPFHALSRTIVYQQLSARSAEPIFRKTLQAVYSIVGQEGDEIIPELISRSAFSVKDVDGKKKVFINDQPCGLSEAKAKYLRSLAEHFSDPLKLKDVDLASLSDTELFEKLTAVQGLGPWSVHMFMIFTLKRQNVLAIGDLGVRKGVAQLYNVHIDRLKGKKGKELMLSLCSHWAPYMSLGTCLMWQSQMLCPPTLLLQPMKRQMPSDKK